MSARPEPHSPDSARQPLPLERLSAAVDGDPDALDGACAAFRDDAELRRRWHDYHLIGDVMRSTELAQPAAHDAAFLAALRTRLADEPVVLAPAPLAAPRRRWSIPAAAVASMAGVAVVAGALVMSRPDGGEAALGVAQLPATAPPAAALSAPLPAVPAFAGGTTVARGGVERNERLDEFLRVHQGLDGFALPRPETRPVGFDVATPGALMRRRAFLGRLAPTPALGAAFACLTLAVPGLAHAQGAAEPPRFIKVNAPMADPVPAAEAQQWLARIQAAARQGNYVGTLVYSSQGQLSSSRVWHFRIGDTSYERLESMDGRQQRILRVNERVQTLWPQRKVAVVETRQTLSGWGTTPAAVDPLALESYRLLREQIARVAGREAQVLLLEPRDQIRYAQRLWADIATGLMLRADVLAAQPGVPVTLESHAFSEIDQNVKPDPAPVTSLFDRLDGYRVLKPMQQATTLEDEGWFVARPVGGFRLAGCMKRGMAAPEGHADSVLQAVFSDGLTHVSVFVEPYMPERHRQSMLGQRGATATLSTRRGEHWMTVVGDVPPATLARFAEALERRP